MSDLTDSPRIEGLDDFEDVLNELGHRFLAVVETADIDAVKEFVQSEDPPIFFQDPESGWSALHIATMVESPELIQYLIEQGAIWNAVDHLGNTCGDVALSLNNVECYNLIRDTGIRAEFILRALGDHVDSDEMLTDDDQTASKSTEAFLKMPLTFSEDENGQAICSVKVNKGENVGVMMGWELPIMQRTVELGCKGLRPDFSVLNVGFGLGMIDTLFQAHRPTTHVIIEAHPDVLKHMRANGELLDHLPDEFRHWTGWYDKPGVKIIEGKWQTVLDSNKLKRFAPFDVIYTDTFSEEYGELLAFFERVPKLLKHSGRFSWFNGLGATNALFHDVYTRLSAIHLDDRGLSTEWTDVDLQSLVDVWSGTRPYFTLPIYRLPMCTIRS